MLVKGEKLKVRFTYDVVFVTDRAAIQPMRQQAKPKLTRTLTCATILDFENNVQKTYKRMYSFTGHLITLPLILSHRKLVSISHKNSSDILLRYEC